MTISEPTALRAVIFDLDGTILDRSGSLPDVFGRQWERYSTVLTGIARSDYVESAVRFDVKGYAPRQDLFRNLIDRFGLPGELANELLADFSRWYPKSCRLYADVGETLSSLREDGFRLGLITNGPVRTQEVKIESLGLRDAFDTIVISEAEGVRKPDAEIFWRAARRLGVQVGEAVYVGDNPEADIGGARGAGMRAIWRRDPAAAEAPPADAMVDEIGEVLDVVRRWRTQPPVLSAPIE